MKKQIDLKRRVKRPRPLMCGYRVEAKITNARYPETGIDLISRGYTLEYSRRLHKWLGHAIDYLEYKKLTKIKE